MISLERNCPTTPMATEIRNSSRQPTCTAEESCPAPELSGSIVEHFARIVAAAAPHPALWHDGVSISYGAMNSRANQIANVILAHTTAATPLVALLFTQGIDPLVAMMGVLKAGKAYVTLDANAVPHQLLAILEDAQATIVLTNQQTLAAAQVIADAGYHVINLDALQSASGEDPHVPTDAETRMAVYYTSGSTGKPKGLERNHRFTVRVALRNVETYQYIPGDRVAVTLHWQWGMAAEAYYGGLLGGATIYLCALNKQSVTDFIQWLAVHQINVVYLPIGFYRTMIDSLQGNEKWQALRFVVLGGDPLYAADIDAFKVHFPPHVTIDYRLGLTEASTLTSIQIDHTTELEGPTVPVGYPCRFQEITIHDEADQPLGMNQIGEIVVKSQTMSTGYWRNPTLTAEKFLPDPEGSDKRIYHTGDLGRIRPDGMLELLGRKDQMVKIRGYRVELTAIEAELMTHPLIDNAVVVAHEDAAGNKQLVAYLITQLSGAEVATLRNTLQKRLPDYMIPSHFMMLDTIPITANGKIDRKALPAPPKSRPDLPTLYIAPRTPIEAQLATIWETILDRRPIGIHDDFFALGGHSLASLQLATELKLQLGQEVPLAQFFQSSTIEELACLLQNNTEANGTDTNHRHVAPMPALSDSERKLLTPFLNGTYFAHGAHHASTKQRILDRALPYALRMYLFRLWSSNRALQACYYRAERRVVSEFAMAIGIPASQINEVVADHLTRMLSKRYCRGVLARALERGLGQHASIRGQSYLDAAIQRGQGVILVNTHGLFMPHLLPIILAQLGYTDFMLYAGKAILQTNPLLYQAFQHYFKIDQKPLVITKFLSLQMDVAQHKLKRGGIVWIAPDGASGSQTFSLPVLGVPQAFSAGFAELAIQTGAAVIPTQRAMTPRGEVQITFWAPLDPATTMTNREERVQHLLQQYVGFLEKSWQLDPANVGLSHIQHFLNCRHSNDSA